MSRKLHYVQMRNDSKKKGNIHEPTIYHRVGIIESVDSISRDERDVPLTQYITNA